MNTARRSFVPQQSLQLKVQEGQAARDREGRLEAHCHLLEKRCSYLVSGWWREIVMMAAAACWRSRMAGCVCSMFGTWFVLLLVAVGPTPSVPPFTPCYVVPHLVLRSSPLVLSYGIDLNVNERKNGMDRSNGSRRLQMPNTLRGLAL